MWLRVYIFFPYSNGIKRNLGIRCSQWPTSLYGLKSFQVSLKSFLQFRRDMQPYIMECCQKKNLTYLSCTNRNGVVIVLFWNVFDARNFVVFISSDIASYRFYRWGQWTWWVIDNKRQLELLFITCRHERYVIIYSIDIKYVVTIIYLFYLFMSSLKCYEKVKKSFMYKNM